MSQFGEEKTQSPVTEIILDRNDVEKQTVTWYGRENRNSLSRGAPSTTRPPLRFGVPMAKRFAMQGVFGDLSKICLWTILQVLALKNRTPQEPAATNGTCTTQSSHTMFLAWRKVEWLENSKYL